MKKNHKKKYLAIAIVLILLSIGIVSGSLAWFTATDTVTNVFSVGSISVEQHETDENGDPFVQDQVLMPILDYDNIENDPNFIHKVVTVENTGTNPAFVRTWIALPKQLDGILCYITNDTDWKAEPNAITFTQGGVEYLARCYVYQRALDNPVESSRSIVSSVLLKGVYLDAAVEIQDNPATTGSNLEFCRLVNGAYTFSGFEVLDANGNPLSGKVIDLMIATQAVQTEGFTEPYEALNTAYAVPNTVDSVPFLQNP